MSILSAVLLVISFVGFGNAGTTSYKGPKSLGPFRIDHDTSIEGLFERLGKPLSMSRDVYCYRSKDGRAFLARTRMADSSGPKVAGSVLLSDFRNCTDNTAQVTPDDLTAWKTEHGIGLGSTVAEIRSAYGRPSREDKVEGTAYRWVIHGDFKDNHYTNEKRPEIGDVVLVYQGASDDLSTAEFGIRRGRVVWVMVSKNE